MNDLISRQAAIDAIDKHIDTFDAIDTNYLCGLRTAMSILKEMPSAQPEIIHCKDCKYWKDSDGVYRRRFDAESKCPLDLKEVYDGTFYCGMAERRTE